MIYTNGSTYTLATQWQSQILGAALDVVGVEKMVQQKCQSVARAFFTKSVFLRQCSARADTTTSS